MATPLGRRPLQALYNFISTQWYTKDLKKLARQIADSYGERNEILGGGVATLGTGLTAAILPIDTTALDTILNGKLKAQLAAQNDADLFTTSGAIGRATYTNGADASGISLSSGATVRIALIACNTGGDGTVVDTDGGAIILVAVVKGTASTAQTQTAFPTSQEIEDALRAAENIHDGGVSWVHVARISWNNPEGTPAAVVTPNRNNHLGA